MKYLTNGCIKLFATGTAFLYISIFCCPADYAQTKTIDGLKQQLKSVKNPTSQLNILLALCAQWESFAPDSLLEITTKMNILAKKLGNVEAAAKSEYYTARAYNVRGKTDTALQICNVQMLLLNKPTLYPVTYDLLWSLKGNTFVKKHMLKEAQKEGFELLKFATDQNDIQGEFNGMLLVGWVFDYLKQYQKSIDWFQKALHLSNDSLFYKKNCHVYFNIAAIYGTIDKMDSAEVYVKKALLMAEAADNLSRQISCLEFQAGIYDVHHQTQLAENAFKKGLALQRKIGDPFYTISILINFADFYVEQGKPDEAIVLCDEGITTAKKNNFSSKLEGLYSTLSDAYEAKKDYKKVVVIKNDIISLKDSMYQKNSSDALAALQVKYDVQQKETIIVKQKLALIQRNVALTAIGILIIVSGFLFYNWFHAYRVRQNKKIQEIIEGEKLLSGEAVIAAEEKERKRIAKNLHDNLGVYAASIASNIEQITNHPQQYKPTALTELNNNSQQMIAQLSDTIWALNTEALPLTEVSDRLKIFTRRIQASYPSITIDVSEDIDIDHELTSSQAFHLFQIIQEAVTNALKYSSGSKISVVIESGDNWAVQIIDDGTGMPQTANKSVGNGLKNMRTRANEAGWNIDWLANTPNGTRVIIKNT